MALINESLNLIAPEYRYSAVAHLASLGLDVRTIEHAYVCGGFLRFMINGKPHSIELCNLTII